MSYKISTKSLQDLEDVVEFYEMKRPGLGLELCLEVGRAIATIEEAPARWPQIEPGLHKYSIDRFPIGVLYRVSAQKRAEIVAIFDLRREPESWRQGLPPA